MKISERKQEHVNITAGKDVRFKNKTSGFEAYDFVHCALPELNYDEISTKVEFLGKKLEMPFMISAMTGGFKGALKINRQLAQVCQSQGIAMAVGSQRQIVENDHYLETFRIVRKTAPDAVIIGNIGASQIINELDFSEIKQMVDLIEADAMALHLNPLQEILQPEGNHHFKGVLKGIEKLVESIDIPVIVKEIGCGISEDVARQLVDAGVTYIDIAGAGGTSWSGIESHRRTKNHLAHQFWDWGIPTALSLQMVSKVRGARIIASGGIKDGVTIAKALALGAELCGAALPILRKLLSEQVEGLITLLEQWKEALRMTMFLTGSARLNALKRKGIIYHKYHQSEKNNPKNSF